MAYMAYFFSIFFWDFFVKKVVPTVLVLFFEMNMWKHTKTVNFLNSKVIVHARVRNPWPLGIEASVHVNDV